MNFKKYLIALSIQLCISCTALHAVPFAYVVSQGSKSVVVIDIATNMIVTDIPIPGATTLEAIAITPDNHFAYVTDPGSPTKTVWVIDITTNSFVAGIPTGIVSGSPLYLAITPDGKYVYVTNSGSIPATFTVIATATNSVVGTFNATGTSNPFDIAIAPNGLTAYITDGGSNKVLPIDITNPISPVTYPTVTVGAGAITGIAITPNGKFAYVAQPPNQKVFPLDLSNPLAPVPGTGIFLPGSIFPQLIVIAPNGTTAYISDQGSNHIFIIDITTNMFDTSVPVGLSPLLPAVTPDSNFLYVPDFVSDNVSVLNTRSLTAVPGTPIFLGPFTTPTDIAIPMPAAAPSNVTGTIKCNVFLLQTLRILAITWTASNNVNVASYNIYNGSTLIANVSATSSPAFNAVLSKCDTGQNFSITAVTIGGFESAHVPVVVR